MKKILFLMMMCLPCVGFASDDVVGYWTTIDDETNSPKSVVQIYEYQGKIYGRVVELFQNKEAVAELPDKPFIKGLDVIWDMEKNKDKYTGGKILDPKKGKVYDCDLWRKGDKLIVRGKIAFLGRNQTWEQNTTFKPETTESPVPKKPRYGNSI
ncbi:MAG: DUF2147 domain-containing protein [Alphaproteobacteria bacterium]|nr:DUF2147 domain-containing protein [Alphaproteobacteria bacterium]